MSEVKVTQTPCSGTPVSEVKVIQMPYGDTSEGGQSHTDALQWDTSE